MAQHEFTLDLDGKGTAGRGPRPRDETAATGKTGIQVDDVAVFKSSRGGVHLDFGDETPFNPNKPPAAPYIYESGGSGQDLVLTVVGPSGKSFPFTCGIRTEDMGLVGRLKSGDEFPVGK